MFSVIRRMFVFTLFASCVAYVFFLVADATIYSQEQSRTRTVWVRDEISPNTHRLAGLVTVPSSCTRLSVKTEKLSDVAYRLAFKTWEDPNLQCAHEPTIVAFRQVVFAPAVGVTFIATLDGLPLPIIIAPTMQ